MDKHILVLKQINKGYGDPLQTNYRRVLTNLEFSLIRGEKVAIAGPSGSGKSTLLNLMGTLDRPDQGDILFDGESLLQLSSDELARFRNQKLGFVFQMHHLLPQCTVWENVLLPVLPLKSRVDATDTKWAEQLLRKVGIWEQRNQHPSSLSGGECQRTAVVRALINHPQLVLADEPTGALDEENAGHLTHLLNYLSSEEGVSLVVVTHSEGLASQMDRICHLKNGNLILG